MAPKRSNTYWTPEIDEAIIRFNSMKKGAERDRFFNKKIYPALFRMAEYWKNKFRGYKGVDGSNSNDVMLAVISHMVTKLNCVNPSKLQSGKNLFSYFNIVARNEFINALRKNPYIKMPDSDGHGNRIMHCDYLNDVECSQDATPETPEDIVIRVESEGLNSPMTKEIMDLTESHDADISIVAKQIYEMLLKPSDWISDAASLKELRKRMYSIWNTDTDDVNETRKSYMKLRYLLYKMKKSYNEKQFE